MSEMFNNEPMLEMYIFETSQMIEQLEQVIMTCEKNGAYEIENINEIFRFMHTIKGSSAMMLYSDISKVAHSIEDLFYFLREQKDVKVNCSDLSDIVFEAVDFVKVELEKIKDGETADGDPKGLLEDISLFLDKIKNKFNLKDVERPQTQEKQQYYIPSDMKAKKSTKKSYTVKISFQNDCEMENIRAFTIIQNMADFAENISHIPENLLEKDDTANYIKTNGLEIKFESTAEYDLIEHFFEEVLFLESFELNISEDVEKEAKDILNLTTEESEVKKPKVKSELSKENGSSSQTMISVNVKKLDKLMDLVGEMVIAEAMVTHNPEVEALGIKSFQNASRQLHKIAAELQDMVMSIRMVPLSSTFLKMHRIVRDMSKKLSKEVELEVIGEETEVDKNIIEHISDPLMHLIRNSIDHGIEENEIREALGKERVGKVTLEAKNSGSDVLVIIKDDGKGLDKEKILKKAKANGLLWKNEDDMTEREIYNLILLPGFSTKEKITEFSGRGVGMDVVVKNLQSVGGSVNVNSIMGKGTMITLKIPLTLAIIEGMNVKVGSSRYTIPITAIKESFSPKENDCFKEPGGNEMIMVRGECYSIVRLHEFYSVQTEIKDFHKGVLIMVEQDEKEFCIFTDGVIGKQQVVIKTLPNYINSLKKIRGIAGCTLLGDGGISLILDVGTLYGYNANREERNS